jgi:hypothetical protein
MIPKQAFATLPKKIKIGPLIYRVRIVKEISGDKEAKGSWNDDSLTIDIVDSIASSTQIVGCIVHEILHGIWDERDLSKDSGEEHIVLQFENGLIQLFQDNPKLVIWMQRGLR